MSQPVTHSAPIRAYIHANVPSVYTVKEYDPAKKYVVEFRNFDLSNPHNDYAPGGQLAVMFKHFNRMEMRYEGFRIDDFQYRSTAAVYGNGLQHDEDGIISGSPDALTSFSIQCNDPAAIVEQMKSLQWACHVHFVDNHGAHLDIDAKMAEAQAARAKFEADVQAIEGVSSAAVAYSILNGKHVSALRHSILREPPTKVAGR